MTRLCLTVADDPFSDLHIFFTVYFFFTERHSLGRCLGNVLPCYVANIFMWR
jgi:hypothetical protein